MKYVDEFRDPIKARYLVQAIAQTAQKLAKKKPGPINIMEVCGGHTHSIFRYGLNHLLPENIEFIHGPGCPVCVLPTNKVDDCIAIAAHDNVIFTTFGDAMRVPGSSKSLLQAKAEGLDIRMVYSPLDALSIARENPNKEVVFFGLGFDTTMPPTALTLIQAKKEQLNNFSLFCNHITIVPTLKAVLEAPDVRLDGLLGPGHVSMVIGTEAYRFIPEDYHKPMVIAGFEPLDILQSLSMVLQQIENNQAMIENQYARVVPPHGNPVATQAIATVFEQCEQMHWRGLGPIENSGVKLTQAFADYDADNKFSVSSQPVEDPKECQCAEVLKGVIKPWQCQLFGGRCTPGTPMGALMVSSEGACSAYYQYGEIKVAQAGG